MGSEALVGVFGAGFGADTGCNSGGGTFGGTPAFIQRPPYFLHSPLAPAGGGGGGGGSAAA